MSKSQTLAPAFRCYCFSAAQIAPSWCTATYTCTCKMQLYTCIHTPPSAWLLCLVTTHKRARNTLGGFELCECHGPHSRATPCKAVPMIYSILVQIYEHQVNNVIMSDPPLQRIPFLIRLSLERVQQPLPSPICPIPSPFQNHMEPWFDSCRDAEQPLLTGAVSLHHMPSGALSRSHQASRYCGMVVLAPFLSLCFVHRM